MIIKFLKSDFYPYLTIRLRRKQISLHKMRRKYDTEWININRINSDKQYQDNNGFTLIYAVLDHERCYIHIEYRSVPTRFALSNVPRAVNIIVLWRNGNKSGSYSDTHRTARTNYLRWKTGQYLGEMLYLPPRRIKQNEAWLRKCMERGWIFLKSWKDAHFCSSYQLFPPKYQVLTFEL